MSEMVDRVARAIFRAGFNERDPDSVVEEKWRHWDSERRAAFREARAAIAAMREPTEEMADAGLEGLSRLTAEIKATTGHEVLQVDDMFSSWRAMIDAALKD